MGITADALAKIILETPSFRFLELESFLETEKFSGSEPTALKLGYIELYDDAPMFYTNEYSFAGMLSDTASFHIVKFDVPEVALRGYAAIFRNFKNAIETDETVACWVKPESKAELERRVRFMNRHIAKLLKLKESRRIYPISICRGSHKEDAAILWTELEEKGVMDFTRIVLKDDVHRDSFGPLAWTANWDFMDIIQSDGKEPFEKVWVTSDQLTAIRYREDPLLNLRYLLVEGKDQDKVLAEIRQEINTYSDTEIQTLFEMAKNEEEYIHAIRCVGIAALPRKFSQQWFKDFEAALSHPSPEVRDAAILALSYVGWRQFEPLLQKLAQNDPDEQTRDFAQRAIVALGKHQWEKHTTKTE